MAASSDDCVVAVPAAVLPDELTDVACKLVFFVSPNVLSVARPTREALEVRLVAAAHAECPAVARDAGTVVERLMRGYRPLQLRTLFQRGTPDVPWSAGGADLTEQLAEKGWVRQHDAGLWALGPEFVGVMEAIDALLRDVARDEYGACAHAFPALISARALRRAGYLTSFPQNTGFVSHLPQNLDALTRFQEANAASAGLVWPEGTVPGPPEECLPPAVCYHRFHDLADQTVTGSVITARGTCFRYEARHNMRSLARLWSFQMREIIYAGTPDYVQGAAERGPAVLESLLERLGLSGWCESATDPFFINVFGAKRYAQVAGELKFELRLPLGAGESLAAASLNLHLDYFGKAFQIATGDGAPVTSGCTAFGLERLALGFLAQHGFDEERWPDAVAERARAHAVVR